MIDIILVLGLLALGDELPAQSGKSSKSSTPPAPAPAPVQEGERPALSMAEIKMLRDTNIFAPKSAKRSTRYVKTDTKNKSETPAAPPKPKPPVVTGIFYDAKAQTFLVVVEDRNSDSLKQFKEPKFLKTGDEVAGYKVASVTEAKAVFTKGDLSKDLKVGESLPGSDGKPVSVAPVTDDPDAAPVEGDEKVDVKPLDPETSTKALEELRKKVGKKNRPSKDE